MISNPMIWIERTKKSKRQKEKRKKKMPARHDSCATNVNVLSVTYMLSLSWAFTRQNQQTINRSIHFLYFYFSFWFSFYCVLFLVCLVSAFSTNCASSAHTTHAYFKTKLVCGAQNECHKSHEYCQKGRNRLTTKKIRKRKRTLKNV